MPQSPHKHILKTKTPDVAEKLTTYHLFTYRDVLYFEWRI
jgi:hypothetical protein